MAIRTQVDALEKRFDALETAQGDDGRGLGIFYADPFPEDVSTVYKTDQGYAWCDTGAPCRHVVVVEYEARTWDVGGT